MQNALNGDSGGALTLDYRGKEVVAAWRYLPLMKWGIVVQIDADEAFASVYKVHYVGLTILVLTLLAALLGAILFNRRVVDPLKHLNRSALEISTGNLHQRVAIEGWDEMKQLAHTFNMMVERLNASNQERSKAEKNLLQLNQELEKRVAIRTADLQRANASLAIKEEEVRSVVLHMVDCVVTTDEKGTILSANPVMEKLFGYSHDELIGKNVSIIVPEPDRSKHEVIWKIIAIPDMGRSMWAALICPARMAWSCREVEGVHKMVNVLSYIWQSVNILWEENGIYRCHAGYPRTCAHDEGFKTSQK